MRQTLRHLLTGLAALGVILVLAGCGGENTGLAGTLSDMPLAPVVDTGVRGTVTLNIAWPQAAQAATRYIPMEAVKITVSAMGQGGDVKTVDALRPEEGWPYQWTMPEVQVTIANITGPEVRLSAVAFDDNGRPVAWGHGDASITNGGTGDGHVYLNSTMSMQSDSLRMLITDLRWVRNSQQAPVVGQWWAVGNLKHVDGTDFGQGPMSYMTEIFVAAGGRCYLLYQLPDPAPTELLVPITVGTESYMYSQVYAENKTMKSFAPKFARVTPSSSPQYLGVTLLTPCDAGAEVAVQ